MKEQTDAQWAQEALRTLAHLTRASDHWRERAELLASGVSPEVIDSLYPVSLQERAAALVPLLYEGQHVSFFSGIFSRSNVNLYGAINTLPADFHTRARATEETLHQEVYDWAQPLVESKPQWERPNLRLQLDGALTNWCSALVFTNAIAQDPYEGQDVGPARGEYGQVRYPAQVRQLRIAMAAIVAHFEETQR